MNRTGSRRERPILQHLDMPQAGLAMGLCLMSLVLGALSLAGTKSWFLFGVVVLPAVLISAISIVRIIYRFRVNVFSLVFFGTVLWYAGPLVVGAFPGSALALPNDPFQTAVSIGVIAISLAFVLILNSILPKPLVDFSWPRLLTREREAQALLLAITLLMLLLMISGRWTFGSLSSNIQVEGKQLLLGAQFLATLTFPLSGALLASSIRRARIVTPETASMAACVVVALVWALVSGRRNFAVAVILQTAGFLAVFWRNRSVATVAGQSVVVALAAAVLITTGWQAFYMMRVASYSLQRGGETPSLTEMYRLSKVVDRRVADVEYANNLSTRGAIINSVSVVSANADGVLLGEGAINAIGVTIPSLLFPGKAEWERDGGGNQERLWSVRLGVPLTDWANTLFLDGYADFSVFGLPLYLLLITGMATAVRLLTAQDPLGDYLLLATVLYALLNVEGGLTAFAVAMRNLVVILLLWRVYVQLAPQRGARRRVGGYRLPVVRT